MARAKSKTSTTTALMKSSGGKVASKSKVVKKLKPAAKKAVAKAVSKKAAARKPAKTASKPAKPAPKKAKAASKAVKPAPKKVARTTKPVPKRALKATKPVAKPVAKVAPKKAATPAKKPLVAPKPSAKKTASPLARPAKAAAPAARSAEVRKSAPAPVAKVAVAAKPATPKVAKPRRTRRGPRVTPTSAPLATWISQEGTRPSSFIPAPPRAKSAFTVAAAPASSDRLMRDEDLAPPKPIKTVPVLIHVEQDAGRIHVRCYPPVVTLTAGAAVEWDFRYFGGVDVLVDHIVIEIQKPSPFSKALYKSPKPGSARPHRQLTDLVSVKSAGHTVHYTIHAVNANRTELATGKAIMEITS